MDTSDARARVERVVKLQEQIEAATLVWKPAPVTAGLIDSAAGGEVALATVPLERVVGDGETTTARVAVVTESFVVLASFTDAWPAETWGDPVTDGPVVLQVLRRSSIIDLRVELDGVTRSGDRSDVPLGRVPKAARVTARFRDTDQVLTFTGTLPPFDVQAVYAELLAGLRAS